jgi:hypothetical protein
MLNVALAASLLLAIGACTSSEMSHIDEKYSWDLSLQQRPEPPATRLLLQTVEFVQVFKGADKPLWLSGLSHLKPIYETRSRADIDELFAAVRDQTHEGCDWRRDMVYHMLAYDGPKTRIAYFKSRRVTIRSVGDLASVVDGADRQCQDPK